MWSEKKDKNRQIYTCFDLCLRRNPLAAAQKKTGQNRGVFVVSFVVKIIGNA